MIRARLMAAFAGLLSLTWVVAAQDANPAAKPENRDNPRHKEFLERAKKAEKVDVLFIGDSITQGWEGAGKEAWVKTFAQFNPFNLGISGDRTQHVIWRLTEGKEIEGLSPKAAVIMIGTNNSGGNSAEEIAGGIKRIIEILKEKKPGIKILVLGVFPRAGMKPSAEATETKAASLQPKIKAINDIVTKYADGKSVKYLDIGDKFLDASGNLPKKIMPDYLHLSPEGYKIWADAVEQPIKDLLKN